MMSFVDKLIDTSPAEGEYELSVGSERFVLKYRLPKSLEEYERLGADIRQFIQVVQSPACPVDWEPYLPISSATAEKIKLLQSLVYEVVDAEGNAEPLSELDAIRFAHANGFLFLQVVTELLTKLGGSIAEGEKSVIEKLGESSGATQSVARI